MECAPRTVSTTAPQCSRNYVEFRLYKARKDLGLFSARVPGWGGDQGGGRDGADLSSIDVSGELKVSLLLLLSFSILTFALPRTTWPCRAWRTRNRSPRRRWESRRRTEDRGPR